MIDLSEKKPIIMVCGLLGTGKTVVSKFLLNNLKDYTRFSTDDVRRILGCKEFDRKDTPKVNEYMYSRTRKLIQEGKGAIFDSIYKTIEARQRVYDLAREGGVEMIIIQAVCSHETARNRIANRPAKDGLHKPTNKLEDYEQYVKLWEEISSELGETKNKHVSYLKFDTETYKTERILIRPSARGAVSQTEEILKRFKGKEK